MEMVRDKAHVNQTTEGVLEPKDVQEKGECELKRFSHKPPEAIDLQIAMAQMLKLQAAPKPDIDVFTGNPLDYQYFKATFKEVLEQIVTDQRGRLIRLFKYTQGDAKDLIKHFAHADPIDCYDKAIALLDKEYGNQHLLSCSYIKELRQWKNVKESDIAGVGLYRYDPNGYFQITCLTGGWTRRSISIRRDCGREADFSDLVRFVEKEAEVLSDPAYSRGALADANSTRVNSYATHCNQTKAPKCALCEGEHDIEDREDFLQKDTDQRHKAVFQLGLCFRCLKPISEQHTGKTCPNVQRCQICNSNHPTTLHGGKAAKSNHTMLEKNIISMCVVPVLLWHKDQKNKKISTYALLDDCSQATFISEDVLDTLDVKDTRTTSIQVKTLNGAREDQSTVVEGLVVQCIDAYEDRYPKIEINLPTTFSRPELAVDREEIPTPTKIKMWDHFSRLQDIIPEHDPSMPIGLMIGGNCPSANEPWEVIQSVDNEPFAKRSCLGWCIIGPIGNGVRTNHLVTSNLTKTTIPVTDASTGEIATHHFSTEQSVHDTFATSILKEMYASDFNEEASEKKPLSFEDERFLHIMQEGTKRTDGKYELPLPFRKEPVCLPNNKSQAMSRLKSVKKKLLKDKSLRTEYTRTIESLISKGHARRADISVDRTGEVWYIPHHAVYNKQKGKLRVVFDGSASFKGRCLNEELIQGPDLTNSLVGVLVRFRKEDVAIMADIEAMYHQVNVPDSQRSFLRFLWWPDGNFELDPEEYEMCVHIFGAVSSGGCANFALKRTADDFAPQFGNDTAQVLRRNFYIDDLLKSVKSVLLAIKLICAVRKMCAAGGFILTKVVSNSREVIESTPIDCRAPSLINLDLANALPVERALGVCWCVENDALNFRIALKDNPLTRRGILGTISSIFDPLELASAFLLQGRRILQAITLESSCWDDEVSPEMRCAWEKWRDGLPALQEITINRCYKPKGFEASSSSLISFSDASDYGYGTATYIRQVSKEGDISVSLLMGNSRVVPNKSTTVPRMELVAALVSSKVVAMLTEELDIPDLDATFWTDSNVVLGYIHNDVKRFRTFVANRAKKIRSLTSKDQWNYINTDYNPADDASRGLSIEDSERVKRWFEGPQFLWEKDFPVGNGSNEAKIPDNDPEVLVTSKNCSVQLITYNVSFLENIEERISNWMRIKRVLAIVILFIEKLRKRRKPDEGLNVEDIEKAEQTILSEIQHKHYNAEIELLKKGKPIRRSSSIGKLDPFIDDQGLIRVGGRMRKSGLNADIKHPVILPKKVMFVQRIIEWYHRQVQHLGRTTTLNELRSHGYWIMSAGAQVRSVISRCFLCKLYRGRCLTQKMADLPADRMEDAPPFTYCGVDMFGPFLIKERRSELKRYGMIYTCMSCRAIHLETVNSADTDSFILSLRRFLARRGPVRSMRSDNGGNFVGADAEMVENLKKMDQQKIKEFLLERSCDWLDWERNPAESSHMGGIWERQIRSVKNVLSSLLKEHAARLDDESLRTLLTEVESIVNSRPLSVEGLNDCTIEPLTPNHLLTMKSKVVLPPPGVFQKADIYCRKRWRTVQYLANQFWNRWRKEFLMTLQERNKWRDKQHNLKVGDIVLVKDADTPRNKWPMGCICEAIPGDDGLVRKVIIKRSDSDILISRSVTKVVLLMKSTNDA